MSKFKSLFSRGGGVQCAFCGTGLKKNEMFCPNCGQPRPEEYAAAEPEYAPAEVGCICPACGNPMEEGDRFCMNCGAKREDAAMPEADTGFVPSEPDMPMGFEEAAPFIDEAPFVEEEIPPRAGHRPAHLRAEEPQVDAPDSMPEPATAVFMTDDEPVEAVEEEAEPEDAIEVIDESAIWGRPAEENEAAIPEADMPFAEEEAEEAEEAAATEPAPAEQTFLIDGEEPAPAPVIEAAENRPAVAAPSMYGLRFIAEPDRELSILRSGAMIGRLSACSLVLDEPSISRRHCHIDLIGGQWKMIVLGVNGIVIDGEHYSNEYGRPIPLSDGCIIEFPGIHGNIAVQFLAEPFVG